MLKFYFRFSRFSYYDPEMKFLSRINNFFPLRIAKVCFSGKGKFFQTKKLPPARRIKDRTLKKEEENSRLFSGAQQKILSEIEKN